jgi:hypothetical protein
MLISFDRPYQSDRAGYRVNHSPFVCRHASRGRITYILRGSPTIPSTIPMVLLDDTPTGCMPYGQTVLAGILPSGFTPSSRIRHRSIEMAADCLRLRWHDQRLFLARANPPLQVDQPQPIEPAFNTARRHGYPRCKTRVPAGSIRSRYHPFQVRSPPLTRSKPRFRGNVHAS